MTPCPSPVPRRDALLLLAVLGAGVFLAGLELMVTAVALPAIVADVAGWTRLREASWIINGYLLVYVVTMPLAGRLADLWGTRRLFLWALVVFTVGSACWPGWRPTLELLIAARLVQAVGGGALVPVATSAASHLFPGAGRPRALGVIGALTFLGMAAGPFLGRGDPGRVPPGGGAVAAGRRRRARSPAACSRPPGAGCSTSTSRSGSSPSSSPGPPAAAGRRRDARAGSTSSGADPVLGLPGRRRSGALTLLGSRAEPESGGLDPAIVAAVLAVGRRGRGHRHRRPRRCGSATRSSTRGCSGHAGFASATVGLGADGYALRDRDRRRRRCSSIACSTAAPTSSAWRSARSRARRPSARSRPGFIVRVLSLRLVTLVGPRGVDRRRWS